MILLRSENFGGIAFNTKNAHELYLDHELFNLFIKASEGQKITNKNFIEAINKLGSQLHPTSYTLPPIAPLDVKHYKVDVLNSPTLIDINITQNCNLHCPHCYINSQHQAGQEMSLDDFHIILNQCKKANVFQVALGGGEPTTHPHLTTFLKKLRQNNIVPNITTNGKKLSLKTLFALTRYAGAVALSTEFIGDKFEKRRGFPYAKFVKSIKKLKRLGINVVFQITLSRDNLSELDQTLKELIKYKPYGFLFLAYKPQGRGKNYDQPISKANRPEILKTIEIIFSNLSGKTKIGFDCCLAPMLMGHKNWQDFKGCSASRESLAIMPNLDVLPCSFIVGQAPVDNLRDKNLLDIWQNKNFQDFRQKLASKRDSKKCSGCQKKGICLGGCPYFNLANCLLTPALKNA